MNQLTECFPDLLLPGRRDEKQHESTTSGSNELPPDSSGRNGVFVNLVYMGINQHFIILKIAQLNLLE